MLHADTKSKSILCDGRVLILSAERHKISKTLFLKVEGKLYEILVTEEEWRVDPDWWLAEEDRNGGTTTGSEYSLSKNGEADPELMASEIHGDDEADIEDELLQETSILNLNNEEVTVVKQWVREEGSGPVTELGLRLDSNDGPKEGFGPVWRVTKMQESGGLGSNSDSGKEGDQQGVSGGEINNNMQLGFRDSRERKRRDIKDCYPKVPVTSYAAGSQWSSRRTTMRSHRTLKVQQVPATQEQCVGCSSLSDGCIANRNQVIQRELNLQEVRRIFSLGKRLGIQLQDNEEEVQSRLLDLEARDVGQGKEQ
ncbi:hypothetical protein SLE2022_079960 [Rubroshorea leprosula]